MAREIKNNIGIKKYVYLCRCEQMLFTLVIKFKLLIHGRY
jgi:hypothetical protein